MSRLVACIDKGLDLVKPEQEAIRLHVATIGEVAATLDPAGGESARRRADFDAIVARLDGDGDQIHEHIVNVMRSFRAGLFAGGDDLDHVPDNLDLERWFRLPKGHERRIHGHRHAGFGSSRKDRRCCWPWMPMPPTRDRSSSRICGRIIPHVSPSVSVMRFTGARP